MMNPEDFYTKDSHNEGASFEVLDKLGERSGCRLTVVGPDSDVWRDVLTRMQRDTLLNSYTNARSHSEMMAEFLAEAVISSEGFEGEMDKQRITKLFIMAPYIADQVDSFVTKRGNFIKPSGKK